MKMMRTTVWIGICGALLVGCGKEEQSTPAAQPAPGQGAAAGAKTGEEAGSVLGDMAEKAGEQAREALEAYKAEYNRQLETHSSKVEALKAAAKTMSDEKLSGLLSTLDEKLAAARTKLSELSGSDLGATAALKQELTALMNELPTLYEQAMARLTELQGQGLPQLPGR